MGHCVTVFFFHHDTVDACACIEARETTGDELTDPALEEDADQACLWLTHELRYGLGAHTDTPMRTVLEEEGHLHVSTTTSSFVMFNVQCVHTLEGFH